MLFAIQSQTSLSMRDLKTPLLLFFIISSFSLSVFFFFPFFCGGVQSTRGSTFSSQAPYAFYFEKKKKKKEESSELYRTGWAGRPRSASVLCDDLLPVETPNTRILTGSLDGLASCPLPSSPLPSTPLPFNFTLSQQQRKKEKSGVSDCYWSLPHLIVGVGSLG